MPPCDTLDGPGQHVVAVQRVADVGDRVGRGAGEQRERARGGERRRASPAGAGANAATTASAAATGIATRSHGREVRACGRAGRRPATRSRRSRQARAGHARAQRVTRRCRPARRRRAPARSRSTGGRCPAGSRRPRRARAPRARRARGRRGAGRCAPRGGSATGRTTRQTAASGSSQAICPPTCALNIRQQAGGAAEAAPPPPMPLALAEDPAEAVVAEDQVPDGAVGRAADVGLRAGPERDGERPRGADGDHRQRPRRRAGGRGRAAPACPPAGTRAPSAGTTIQPCSILVMNARPTTAPASARCLPRPDSIARTVKYAEATSSRIEQRVGVVDAGDGDRDRRQRQRGAPRSGRRRHRRRAGRSRTAGRRRRSCTAPAGAGC